MNKILALVVLLVSFCSVVNCGEPDERLHHKCMYPTIMVYDYAGCSGSGVIVRSVKYDENLYLNVALTCDHVIDSMKDVKVNTIAYKNWSMPNYQTAQEHDAIVQYTNKDADIAVLFFFSNTEMPTAELGLSESIYVGNDIITFGCALGTTPRCSFGKVTGVSENKVNADVLTIPGDSGGPVYHDYKLIALKQAIRLFPSDNNYESPDKIYHHSINTLLKQLVEIDKVSNVSFVYNNKETLPKLQAIILLGKMRFNAMTAY